MSLSDLSSSKQSVSPLAGRQVEMDFFDPVSLAESVTNAEIDIEQRSAGSFSAKLMSVLMPQSELSRGKLNQSYLLRGTYPAHVMMFSYWLPGSDPMKIKGVDITPNDTLVVGQHRAETEMFTHGENHFGTFAMDRRRFFELAEVIYQLSPDSLGEDVLILPNSREAMAPILKTIQEIEVLSFQTSEVVSPVSLMAVMVELEKKLMLGFLDIVANRSGGMHTKHRPVANHRRQLLKKADDYFQMHRDSPVSLLALCQAVGASKRALQYAFQDAYDTTPMSHLKMFRLNQARRDLLRESPETSSVTTIAFQHGCSHLGRFAGEYRQYFGESPSETLRRRLK